MSRKRPARAVGGPLAAGLAFGLAPVQFGVAVTAAVPSLDRPEEYRLVYALALAHAAAVSGIVGLLPGGTFRRHPWAVVRLAYLLPLGGCFLAAAANSPAVAAAWRGVVAASRPDPDARNPAAERLGVDPPRAAPPADPGPVAGQLADWGRSVGRELYRFLARVWVGTPVWAFALAACAAWWWGRSG